MEDIKQIHIGMTILMKYITAEHSSLKMYDNQMFVLIDSPVSKEDEKTLREYGWFIGDYNNDGQEPWVNCWTWD